MEFIPSGNPIVDRMEKLHIEGNIIPAAWGATLCYENGKPHLPAMIILGDIVYWYRPRVERDEEGKYIMLKKKFKDDKFLQRSYEQYNEMYGLSKNQAKSGILFLESKGIIKRHFRTILTKSNRKIPNVMYLELNPEKVEQITYPYRSEDANTGGMQLKSHISQNRMRDTDDFATGYPTSKFNTNTEITAETTNGDIDIPSISERAQKDVIKRMFKKQIGYEALSIDYPADKRLLDGIVELVTELMTTQKPSIWIAGEMHSAEIVKERLKKEMIIVDKIYRRKTQSNGTVKKKKDEKKRKRNQTINFHVTQAEKELIKKRIELSGLSMSDFFIESCMYQKILVKGNIKTFDSIKKHLDQIERQLQVSTDLADMEPATVEAYRIILEINEKLYGKNVNGNET